MNKIPRRRIAKSKKKVVTFILFSLCKCFIKKKKKQHDIQKKAEGKGVGKKVKAEKSDSHIRPHVIRTAISLEHSIDPSYL